jgi:hypothetical protein
MSKINQTVVCIRFYGQDLDSKTIGELLGFIESEPFESTIKRLKSGRVVWTIRLENDDPLEKKIQTLLAHFTDEINQWKTATENIKADIFCGLFLDGWNQGFDLTPNLMRELSERNLEIGFDIYAPTDSWDKFMEESNNI